MGTSALALTPLSECGSAFPCAALPCPALRCLVVVRFANGVLEHFVEWHPEDSGDAESQFEGR